MNARIRLAATLLVGAAVAVHPTPAAAQSLRGSRASVDRMHREAVRHDLYF